MDEGIKIKPQSLFDARLSLARGLFRQRLPSGLGAHLKFQNCILSARQSALHAIRIVFLLKGEHHFGGFYILSQVDHITAATARLPEQTPRDRIQQGRFASAVVPRNTGDVEGCEIKLNRIVIREEA